jgi:regulator of sigma E protease
MSFFQPLLSFVVALSLLVLVHEWGHFWVARRSGVRVLKFSIGFGPEIAGWTRGSTRYCVSTIPFGGYVRFAGDNPEEERAGADDEFLSKSVGVRSAIVLAGPAMNYLLAIGLFAAVFYVHGIDTIETTRVGAVLEGSIAEEMGLREGDRILSVNGETVEDWGALGHALLEAEPGGDLRLLVERSGEPVELLGETPGGKGFREAPFGVAPFGEPVVGRLRRGGPAWRAGLRSGDRILSVDGRPVASWTDMARIISENPDREIALVWERAGERIEGTVTPESVEGRGRIGIEQAGTTRKVGPLEALAAGWTRTWMLTKMALGMIPRIPAILFDSLFRGEQDHGLGGPFRMAEFFGEAARWGLMAFLSLMASISAQLAIFNLLPIPVLDGGHLALHVVEVVTRRPPSLRVRIILQQIGFAFLILLMLLVTMMDVGRRFG